MNESLIRALELRGLMTIEHKALLDDLATLFDDCTADFADQEELENLVRCYESYRHPIILQLSK